MKTYKATARGYDGVTLREKGDVFEFGGKPGSWMVEVKGVKAPVDASAKKPDEPSNGKTQKGEK